MPSERIVKFVSYKLLDVVININEYIDIRNKTRQKGVLIPKCKGNAIRDVSSALELTKVWGHKEIPTEAHPTGGLELRRSPIQVLT